MFLQKMLLFRGLSLLLLLGGFSLAVQAQCIEGETQPNGGNNTYGGPDCPNCTGSGTFTVLKLCDTHGSGISLCGPGTIAVDIDLSCYSAKAPLSVYAVNIVENAPIGAEVDWPLDLYPPVHLRYDYDNLQSLNPIVKYSEPIEKWTYIDLITISDGREEYRFKLFEGVASVDIAPLEEIECRSPEPYSIEGMDVDVVYLPATAAGATNWESYKAEFNNIIDGLIPGSNDDPFGFYPITDYGGTDEIFSSRVFTNNCDNCGETRVASAQLTLCVECGDCYTLTPPEEQGEGGENFRLQTNTSDSKLSPLSISPNPFSTYTQYQYFSKVETDIQVRLFSTDGVVLLQEVQKVGAGENTYRLDTQAIPEGAYYLQVKTNTENHMKLIVKIE